MDQNTQTKKHKSRWGLNKRDLMVLLSFFISTIFTFLFTNDDFTQGQTYVFFILIMSVSLWLTEAVPPYSVGLLIIFLSIMLLSGSDEDPDVSIPKLYQTWSSSIIFLMLGGFFLSAALKVTRLDKAMFNYALSVFGTNPNKIILGIMLTTAILSMVMSNTATTAMMIASVSPFVSKFGSKEPFTKAILLGIPTAAAVGGMGTIIGSPPNAIAVASLEAEGLNIDFVEWMIYGFPLAILFVFGFWFILTKRHHTQIKSITIDQDDIEIFTPELRPKQILTICTLIITLGLWLTTPFHGYHVAMIGAIPMVIFTFLGILTAKDIQKLPWDTLILVAGGLTLGEAIQSTHLAEYYINQFQLPENAYIGILVIFGFLTILLSNIMSNTATTSLLVPIGMLLLPQHQVEIALVTGLCASCAILLPVSTPPNAIAYATGLLKQSDFRFGGIVLGLIAPIIIIFYILILN